MREGKKSQWGNKCCHIIKIFWSSLFSSILSPLIPLQKLPWLWEAQDLLVRPFSGVPWGPHTFFLSLVLEVLVSRLCLPESPQHPASSRALGQPRRKQRAATVLSSRPPPHYLAFIVNGLLMYMMCHVVKAAISPPLRNSPSVPSSLNFGCSILLGMEWDCNKILWFFWDFFLLNFGY